MTYVLRFYPKALAMAYGRRPKFVKAKHSATAESENCTYGPTLAIKFEIKASFVLIYAVLLHCCINNLEKARRRALISGSRFRAVGSSEDPWGGRVVI